jgi:hypothetical protein
MHIKFSLDTRTTLAFLTGVLGMIWQGGIATAGGSPSRDLIAASVTLILASIGLGVRRESNESSSSETDKAAK